MGFKSFICAGSEGTIWDCSCSQVGEGRKSDE